MIIVQAFSRAAKENKLYANCATLGEYSGRPAGEPVAAKAKEKLFRIVAAMRGPHGSKLRDIAGRVLYGTAKKFLQTYGLRSLKDLPPAPGIAKKADS